MAAKLASREKSRVRVDEQGRELVMTRVYEYRRKPNGHLALKRHWDWRVRQGVQ
jgi:hypothetical protein